MEIKSERPAGRGVSQLMYVGDDAAVERTWQRTLSDGQVYVGLGCAVAALHSKGAVRLATGGIAALVGLRMLLDRFG